MAKAHTFHIPVMGIGYTIDTPLKVAQFGIDSVISLVDDILMEKMRKFYCEKLKQPYTEISEKVEDYRAERVTAYLNLLGKVAEQKFEDLKNVTEEKKDELLKYFDLLPDHLDLKMEFKKMTNKGFSWADIKTWLHEKLSLGSIDVNIMTKVDKHNYKKKEQLPVEFNDAHAAVRGYAQSKLNSSMVLSAGMNPRLYGYMENFEDFYPNENGEIKKKIVIKVSDYRSALIQGKFLAKKGLWVSEYRIESGLNCGGHAFATDGLLMGPILSEFRDNRAALVESVQQILVKALELKNKPIPKGTLKLKVTAQGGVGTAEEHNFLMDEYNLDSIGWGSPFLLVPEATSIDDGTRERLMAAKEDDLYLSNISPLGVPFNNLRGNTKDAEKQNLLDKGRPGSSCPKRFIALNTEFSDKGLCTASRLYQHTKLKERKEKGMSADAYKKEHKKVTEKSCICVGLGTGSLIANGLSTKTEGSGVSVCPGPNMAYFSTTVSLKQMAHHIYGKANVIGRTDRPNMFIKELGIYVDYLKNKIEEAKDDLSRKQKKNLVSFAENLAEGVAYYHNLFNGVKDKFEVAKAEILKELEQNKIVLDSLLLKVEALGNHNKPALVTAIV